MGLVGILGAVLVGAAVSRFFAGQWLLGLVLLASGTALLRGPRLLRRRRAAAPSQNGERPRFRGPS